MNQPLVSIIMPAYNVAEFIGEAIDSVLNQSYTNWELLIIDNGSSDNTVDLIKEYSDDRIRFFQEKKKGVSAARNLGLKERKADVVCFLDSDDVYPENSIASRLKILQDHPEVDIIDGKVEVFNEQMSEVVRTYIPNFRGNPLKKYFHLSEDCFLGISCMVRIRENGSYEFKEEVSHGEDLLFYIDVAKYGDYNFTDDLVLKVRRRGGSAMTNFDKVEKGYYHLYRMISAMPESNGKDRLILKWKISNVLSRSYLKNLQPFHAVRAIVKTIAL